MDSGTRWGVCHLLLSIEPVGVRLLHREDDGMRFPLVQAGKGTMSEEFEDYDLPDLTA